VIVTRLFRVCFAWNPRRYVRYAVTRSVSKVRAHEAPASLRFSCEITTA
jgi:hypothetical protein